MTSTEFEKECQDKILGNLYDESFNPDYQENISLTITEMRYIANLMRQKEGKEKGIIRSFLTVDDYESCPYCRGSFSFQKPGIDNRCPFCNAVIV